MGIVSVDVLAGAVQDQREALLRRVATLTDEQWDLVCPAPDPPAGVVRLQAPRRTVRDIVAHLLVVDDMLLGGGALRAWAGLRRLEHPGAWDLRKVEPLAALPVPELVALLARRGERIGRLVAGAPSAVRRVPVPGPFGRQSLGGLLGRRVLHEWLHETDIAAAGPQPAASAMTPDVAAVAAEALLRLLPGTVLARIDVRAGVVRLVVELADERAGGGGVQRCIWGLDFARRQYGPRVVTPADATIRITAPALACLAYGRQARLGTSPPADVDGNADVAGAFLSALATPRTPAHCLGFAPAAVAS